MYRIGLIGNRAHQNVYGPIWKKRSDCVIVAAAEHNPQKAKGLSDLYGINVVSDYDAVIEDPEVDIVSICTDFYLKRSLINKAVSCGKHVLVDKSIGRTVAEAKAIFEAVSQTQVKVVLAYPMRFMPPMMRLKRAIEIGEYGRIVAYAHNSLKQFKGDLMAYVSYPTPARQNGGGELMNLGSHVVDYLFWQFGMPKRIFCHMQNAFFEAYQIYGTEDIAMLCCEYDKMTATLTVGRTTARDRDGMVDVVQVNGEGVWVQVSRTGYLVNGREIEDIEDIPETGTAGCVQHLIDCIEQGCSPTTGIHNALAVAQIKTAAYQSAQTGQFVSLPLKDERHPLIDANEQVLDILLD